MLPPSAVRCLRRLSRHSMLVLRAIMDRVSLPSNHLVGQKWTLSLGRGMRAWRQGAAAAVDEDGVLTAIAGMSGSDMRGNDPDVASLIRSLIHPTVSSRSARCVAYSLTRVRGFALENADFAIFQIAK